MRHKVSKCVRKPWPHWHFKQFCPANDGTTDFEADDRCLRCKELILKHEMFLFYNSPDAIRLHPGEANAEWRPCPETEGISGDNGPNRVAYVWEGDRHPDHIGDPVIQVFEGPLESVLWVPCNAVTVSHSPLVWQWICQPLTPKNPAEEDWMRSISS